MYTSFKLLRAGFLGGQVPNRQTAPRGELWRAIQILSREDEKSNIQIPIDKKYVTRGITHRGDLEKGPNGDLWSVLLQLIDERSGVTDVIKVKSHLEDVGPSAITQNKISSHHMLADSWADVVAEEAAERLLPDLNLERKAKKAERIGIGVAKRLALVQADIWAKRGAAGDIYELGPLVVAARKRAQGHLLVRHNKGLKCKACNVYRADRQFSFWIRTLRVPRPCAAEVISQFRNKKRQHNTCTDDLAYGKSVFPSVSQDIQGTDTHMDRFSQLVSPEPEGDFAHTEQFSTCVSPSQVGEQCDGSRYVSAQSHLRGMDGKSRKLGSAKGVVNIPICVAGPPAPLRSNLDDPEEWELPVLTVKVYAGMKQIARNLLLVAQSSSVERRVVQGLVRHLWWDMGIQLGRSQIRVGFVGRPIGFLGMFCLVYSRHLLAMLRKKFYWRPHPAPGSPESRVFSPLFTAKQVNTP